MDFSKALDCMKNGERVSRTAWEYNVKVSLQKGYQEIPCNQKTSILWGIKEGTPIGVTPYFQMMNKDKSFSVWIPSTEDLLAEDWIREGEGS